MRRVLSCSAMIVCVSAVANAEPDETIILPKVYVTGEKQDQDQQQTLTSVAVTKGDVLEKTGQTDLADVFQYTANVNLGGSEGAFVIRGMPSDDLLGASTTPLAQIYVDGATLGDKAARIAIGNVWDVSQVEILRGAQSTFQGRNALAGAIVISTQDPGYEWDTKARLSYLSSDYGDTFTNSLAFGGPILDDKLAFRISAEQVEHDGYVRNAYTGKHADYRNALMLRGKLLYEPAPDLSVLFSAEYNDVKTGNGEIDRRTVDSQGFALPYDITIGSEAKRLKYSTSPDDQKLESMNYALQADWKLSEAFTLSSTTAYSSAEIHARRDHRHGINPTFYPSANFAVQNPFNIPHTPAGTVAFDPSATQYEKQTILSQEFILNYDAGDRLRGRAGLFFTQSKETEHNFDMDRVSDLQYTVYSGIYPLIESEVRNLLAPYHGTPGFEDLVYQYADGIASNATFNFPETGGYYALTSEPLDIENTAVYFEGEFDLTPKILLAAGLRYDQETQTAGLTVSGEPIGLPDPNNLYYAPQLAGLEAYVYQAVVYSNAYFESALVDASTSASQSFDALLPSVSATYKFNDDQSLGFFIRRGYRSGGSDLNLPRQFVSEFGPEYTWNYELSYRSQWMSDRLRVNANLYYTDWTDQQVIVGLSDLPQDEIGFNVGNSKLYGFELESNWQISRNWALDTNLGYSKTQFEQFDVALADAIIRAKNQIPPFSLGADLSFLYGLEFQNAPNWSGSARLSYIADKGWYGFLGVTYEGTSFTNNGNSQFTGYLNNDERMLVDLTVGYRFDNVSLAFVSRNLTDEDYVQAGGYYQTVLGAPRRIGLQLQAAF